MYNLAANCSCICSSHSRITTTTMNATQTAWPVQTDVNSVFCIKHIADKVHYDPISLNQNLNFFCFSKLLNFNKQKIKISDLKVTLLWTYDVWMSKKYMVTIPIARYIGMLIQTYTKCLCIASVTLDTLKKKMRKSWYFCASYFLWSHCMWSVFQSTSV